MLLALIGWRTHEQTVLYNWRMAKYARNDIFNRDEFTRTKYSVRKLKRYKQFVSRLVYISSCKFIIENVMGLQISKQLCSVICANSMEITASNCDKTATSVDPYRAYRISPKHKLNTHGRERGACGSHTKLHQTQWLARLNFYLGSHHTTHTLNIQGFPEKFRKISENVRGKVSSKFDTMIWGRSTRPIHAIPSQIE